MTVHDLTVGQEIPHPTSGISILKMKSDRKVIVKYPKSTRTTTFNSTKAEFEFKDI